MAQTTVRESAPQSPPDGPSRRRPRPVVWMSALVAACAVAVQWVIGTPPLYYDPYYVFEAARRWPDIPLDRFPFDEVPHQVTRIGLVLPARLFQELLGPGQAAYFAMAAAGGIVFFVGCLLVIRSLFGDVLGLSATLLLMVHPFFLLTNPFSHEVTWSTGVLLPDMPGAGLFAIGMACLVTASRREGRAQTRLLVSAGLFMASAFLIRDFVAFMYLGIPVFCRLLGISWRRLPVIAAPMLGVLAVSMIHNQVVFGSAMSALRSAAGHGGEPGQPVTRGFALESFEYAMRDWHPLGTIFLVLLALNVIGWAVTRDRRLALTLVWFLALAAPLTLLSGLLNPDDISLRAWLVRYWFAVFPALLAGGLGAVLLMARKVSFVRARAGLALGLAGVLAVVYVVAAVRTVPNLPRDKAWNELRVWLKDRDDLPVIWSDYRLAQTLTFYTKSMWGEQQWHGRIRSFPHEYRAIPVIAENGPFLYTRWPGREPAMIANTHLTPGDGYRLLWRSSDGLLEIWAR